MFVSKHVLFAIVFNIPTRMGTDLLFMKQRLIRVVTKYYPLSISTFIKAFPLRLGFGDGFIFEILFVDDFIVKLKKILNRLYIFT